MSSLIEELLESCEKTAKYNCYSAHHLVKLGPILEILREHADEREQQLIDELVKDLP